MDIENKDNVKDITMEAERLEREKGRWEYKRKNERQVEGRRKERSGYLCRVYMFDFTFTMPAKLSVCLPVVITVSENKVPYSNMFTFSSALAGCGMTELFFFFVVKSYSTAPSYAHITRYI